MHRGRKRIAAELKEALKLVEKQIAHDFDKQVQQGHWEQSCDVCHRPRGLAVNLEMLGAWTPATKACNPTGLNDNAIQFAEEAHE